MGLENCICLLRGFDFQPALRCGFQCWLRAALLVAGPRMAAPMARPAGVGLAAFASTAKAATPRAWGWAPSMMMMSGNAAAHLLT